MASAIIGLLFALAGVAGAEIHGYMIARSVLRYFPAALLIAAVEEAFFRAFLLAGIERQLGALGALLASSALYAIVHVMRSPARFYLMHFQPWAGVKILAADAERVIHPKVGPALVGLLLLGVLLGEAFLLTRRAYASLGLHAGFVLGAKTWRTAVSGAIPRWLAGPGPVPLVAAPAAWILSIITLIVLYLWSPRRELLSCSEALSRPSPAYPRSSDALNDL
ncbi:MAG: CPBP family intramembrane metalloprotease [Deltaproteobacteria bacterium]|nr:CPBP family intramembrane metalloprotease [Deltaproteobacteria bacterium]